MPCVGRQILNHCATREAPKEDDFEFVMVRLCQGFQEASVCAVEV